MSTFADDLRRNTNARISDGDRSPKLPSHWLSEAKSIIKDYFHSKCVDASRMGRSQAEVCSDYIVRTNTYSTSSFDRTLRVNVRSLSGPNLKRYIEEKHYDISLNNIILTPAQLEELIADLEDWLKQQGFKSYRIKKIAVEESNSYYIGLSGVSGFFEDIWAGKNAGYRTDMFRGHKLQITARW